MRFKANTIMGLALIFTVCFLWLSHPDLANYVFYNEKGFIDGVLLIKYVDGLTETVKQSRSALSQLNLFSPASRRVPISRVDCFFIAAINSSVQTKGNITASAIRKITYYNGEQKIFNDGVRESTFTIIDDMETVIFNMTSCSPSDLFPNGSITKEGAKSKIVWSINLTVTFDNGKILKGFANAFFEGVWQGENAVNEGAGVESANRTNLFPSVKIFTLYYYPKSLFTNVQTTIYLSFIYAPPSSFAVPIHVFGCGFNFTIPPSKFDKNLTAHFTITPTTPGNLTLSFPSYQDYVSISPVVIPVYDSASTLLSVTPEKIYAGEATNITLAISPQINKTGYLICYGENFHVEGQINSSILSFPIMPVNEGIITFIFKRDGYADAVKQITVLPKRLTPIMIVMPTRIDCFWSNATRSPPLFIFIIGYWKTGMQLHPLPLISFHSGAGIGAYWMLKVVYYPADRPSYFYVDHSKKVFAAPPYQDYQFNIALCSDIVFLVPPSYKAAVVPLGSAYTGVDSVSLLSNKSYDHFYVALYPSDIALSRVKQEYFRKQLLPTTIEICRVGGEDVFSKASIQINEQRWD